MEFSNRPSYPIDMDYTCIVFNDFEHDAEFLGLKKFKESFPRWLPIHHYSDPQKTSLTGQVGRISVSHDDWMKMFNENLAATGTFQRDYFIDNIEKAEWLKI